MNRLCASLLLLSSMAAAACAADQQAPYDRPSRGAGGAEDVDPERDSDNEPAEDPNATQTSPGAAAKDPDMPPPGVRGFLWPPKINTGFTGGSEVFQVPLVTDLDGELTWSVADASLAAVRKIDPPATGPGGGRVPPHIKFAMLTTKKSGQSTVTVTNGKTKITRPVVVKAYTSASFAVGETRYKTGGTEENRKPCAQCHEGERTPDHSPTFASMRDDTALLAAIETGKVMDLAGPPKPGEPPVEEELDLFNGNHKWSLTPEEREGIVTYLRALPPRRFQ